MEHQQFSLDFGCKSEGLAEIDGQAGLLISGYATRFGETDAEGEVVDPTAFINAASTFFDNASGNGPVPILFHHGFDETLGTKRMGRVIEHRIDSVGLWIKAFLSDPSDEGLSGAVKERALAVWEGVKSGVIAGFSIGGVFSKLGSKIKKVALYEVSITPAPCLASATFSIATKSLPSLVGVDLDQMIHAPERAIPRPEIDPAEQLVASIKGLVAQHLGGKASSEKDKESKVKYGLSRGGHGKALAIATKEGSISLHDHLLDRYTYPLHMQGDHSPSDCTVCCDEREMWGEKSRPAQASPTASTTTSSSTGGKGAQTKGTLPSQNLSPLPPAAALAYLGELYTLGHGLTSLHSTLSTAVDGTGADEQQHTLTSDTQADTKAGKRISGLTMKSLRSFASAVVDCGQQLHVWLDANEPEPQDDSGSSSSSSSTSKKE